MNWADGSQFLVDVDSNPSAFANLVFPETKDPMAATGLDSSTLHDCEL
jgi:hypothetical protein